MSRSRFRIALIALATATLCHLNALPVAGAEDEEGEEVFKFTVDPVVFRPLFVDVDTRSSKFEEYRDMDSGMTVPLLRLLGVSGDRNRTFELEAQNISRGDARYSLRYGNSGSYSILLDYNVIPHRFGNDGTFLYSNSSARSLRISDAIQQSLQSQIATQFATDPNTVDFAFLGGILQPFIDTAQSVDLSLDRRRSHARIDIHKLRKMAWVVDLKQETRRGTRPYGGSFGFSNIVEIPEPIDYQTTSADLSGEWNGERGGLRFGVRASRFDNSISSVSYDNPFRIQDSTDGFAYAGPGSRSIAGPAAGRNALAPDNTANDVYVSGRAKLGSRGWVNGNIRYGMMEQSDRLLPFTSNTAIDTTSDPNAPFLASDPGNLPTSNADTEVKLLNVSANAGTRISPKTSIQFRYRYYDYDNQSSRVRFPGYVRFDAVWEAIPRITVPYSYTQQRVGVEFDWDVNRSNRLGFSVDREMWDREFREIEDSDENIFRITYDARPGKRLSLRAALERGDRSIGTYETEAQELSFLNPTGINNQPGLRKYDQAEREYDAGNVTAIIMASDSINVTAGVSARNEDFDESEFGLVSYDTLMYNAEFSYMPNEKISFFIFAHRTDAESFQRARQSGGTLSTNPADDWELTLDEVTDSWGLGFESRFAERWTGSVLGTWSNSNGDSDFFSPPGGSPNLAEDFSEYDDNEWLVVSGRLGLIINEHASAGLTLAREEYTTNRFQRDGLAPYFPGSLILNPVDGDYDANILAFDLRLTF